MPFPCSRTFTWFWSGSFDETTKYVPNVSLAIAGVNMAVIVQDEPGSTGVQLLVCL